MKWFFAVLIVISCVALATWAVAGDPQANLTQVEENHKKCADRAPGNPEIAARLSDPISMLAEIRAVMDSTRRSEQVIKEEFGTNLSPELTRRLGELKKTSRMRILHIQLKYAKDGGRTELVRRIIISIEDLQRPAAPGGPRLSGGISPTPAVQAAATPAGGSQR